MVPMIWGPFLVSTADRSEGTQACRRAKGRWQSIREITAVLGHSRLAIDPEHEKQLGIPLQSVQG